VRQINDKATTRIPSEPYPELRPIVERFTAGVQDALKRNFIGAYLVGSLAIGDFDLDSDVDFLIIIDEELTDAEVASLQSLHIQIHNLGSYPAQHLEGSYISKRVLCQADLVGVQPLWYIDDGSTLLERSVHDNQWHLRWVLRERAIVLAGPDPRTLMQPVSTEALRTEMTTSLATLRTHFLAEIGKALGWFNTRFGQSFTVLTCCRMLHTLQTGGVESKLSAMQWAQHSLHAEWHELIRHAWAERKGVRFGVKVRQPADGRLLQQTVHFIAYAQNELGRRDA
jgi:hypothetical protein